MIDEVRSGIVQEKYHSNNWGILSVEILLLAIGLGMAYRSWYVFGGVFFGLIILFSIPIISGILSILFSISWGFCGWNIGKMFNSLEASVVLGAISFCFGLAVHSSALVFLSDLTRRIKKE